MPLKRPEPLSEDLMEPGHGVMLLGRTHNVVPQPLKKADIAAARTPTKQHLGVPEPASAPAACGVTPLGSAPTPGGSGCGHHRAATPLSTSSAACPTALALNWAFTPMATPSPSGRIAAFEQLHLASVAATPTAAAAQLAAAITPSDLFLGGLQAAQLAPPAPVWAQPALPLPGQKAAAALAAVAAADQGHPVAVSLRVPATLANVEEATAPGQPQQPQRRWSSERDGDSDEEEDSDEEGLQQMQVARGPEDVPQPPPGAEHPSLGSEGHELGTCKRCCFFPRGRCMNGYECEFCHHEHEKRKRKNKKKSKKVVTGSPTMAPPSAAATTLSAALGAPFCAATAASPAAATGLLSAAARPFVPQAQQPLATASPLAEQQSSYSFCAAATQVMSYQDEQYSQVAVPPLPMGTPASYLGGAPAAFAPSPMQQQQQQTGGCAFHAPSPLLQTAPVEWAQGCCSSPAPMGGVAELQQPMYHQLGDGARCMMQPTQMVPSLPQYGSQPQPQPQQAARGQTHPGTHIVMLAPAMMSSAVQSPPSAPQQHAQPVAPPPAPPALPLGLAGASASSGPPPSHQAAAPRLSDVPPPPPGSPRLGPIAA